MASLTILPKCSVVNIVFAMAGTADRLEDGLSGDRFIVARMTVEPTMGAGQRKAGQRVVIEVPLQPTAGSVAGDAIVAQPTFVERILMALLALEGRRLEILALVAIGTRYGFVAPDERKTGSVVIEVGCLLPTRLVVAGGTIGSECALVEIVLLMTTYAGQGQFVFAGIGAMAAVAGDCSMCTS